jgi:hypothetical protein
MKLNLSQNQSSPSKLQQSCSGQQHSLAQGMLAVDPHVVFINVQEPRNFQLAVRSL